MNIRTASILAFLLCWSVTNAPAQDLPPLEIENVTVIGKRMVVLPKARKGEVLDTFLYVLPPGDAMIFGERISNLGGTGGALPGYREFELPLRLDAEASIGSYLSPHGMFRAEYVRPTFDLSGVIDYRSTAGHIDSTEASSLMLGGHGSVLIGEEIPPLRSFRISLDFDHRADGYFLYGNPVLPFDRSRVGTQFILGLKSEEETPVGYAVGFRLANTSVEDRRVDTVRDVTAMTPSFSFDLAADISQTLRGGAHADFQTTSLNYSIPTQTPSFFSAHGDLEWQPSSRVFLGAGLVFGSSGRSDTAGSVSLLMPRLSARYEASEQLSLFGWFAPELRPASYRDRIMDAPYVDRQIILRPERVPVNLSGGARFVIGETRVEARGFFESAESTPVVVVEGSTPGVLRYDHVDSRTVGAAASAQIAILPNLSIAGDAIFRSATVADTDEELPMTPAIDLLARGDFNLDPTIDIFATLQFQTDQRTSLSDSLLPNEARRIPARLLLGGGASYRIMQNLQAFAEVSNLLNYTYELWQNYEAPGFEIRGGVRMKF
jgi:outer membrane receptor protein involved in Fe transport